MMPQRHSLRALAAAVVALVLTAAPGRADDPKPKPEPPRKAQPENNPLLPPGLDLQDLLKNVPGLEGMLKDLPFDLNDLLKNLPQGFDPQQLGDLQKQMQQMREQMRKAFEEMRKNGGGQFQFRFGGPFGGGARPLGRPQEGRLGLGVEKPGEALVEQLGLPKGEGLVVGRVREGSPAARAGLKTNDILLQLGGKAVPSDAEQFRELVQGLKPNTPVDAVVLRKGKRETLKGLTIPEAPRPERKPGLKRRPRGNDVLRLAPEALPSLGTAPAPGGSRPC
jgi:hypothetical protein